MKVVSRPHHTMTLSLYPEVLDQIDNNVWFKLYGFNLEKE